MKITEIDFFPIYPPNAKRYQHVRSRNGVYERNACRIATDVGIVGYGDFDGPGPSTVPANSKDLLLGRNPFDFINSNISPLFSMALYDIMGKYLEVPVHKLMGPKLRDAVAVAAWSWGGPTPEEFRDDIARAAQQGYTIFKIHTNPLVHVTDWLRAAAEVAPPGFKIHLDFTGRRGRTLGAVLPLVNELERNYPIIEWIEDPFDARHVAEWKELRHRTHLTIVHGGTPAMGGLQEVLQGMADAYMIGGETGNTLAQGWAYGKLNIQVLFQHCGGTLGKAMALHMASVLPTATGHGIHLDDQCDEDWTTERIPVVEGFSPVSDRPGLGYGVDESKLAEFAANKPKHIPRYVGIVRMPGGHILYSLGQPHLPSITGREEGVIRGHEYERWYEDGSERFEEVYAKVQKLGYFMEEDGPQL